MTRRELLKAAGYGSIGGILTGTYGALTTDDLRLEHQELFLPGWKADGLKVGFIADIHTTRPEASLRAIRAARMVKAEKPDIVILGGDYIRGQGWFETDYVGEFAQELRSESSFPIFAVLGNHDYGPGPGTTKRVVQKLRNNGVNVLVNQCVEFAGVHVVGFDDRLWGHHNPHGVAIPAGAESVIGVLHEPDFVSDLPASVQLTLSGHTHGGQVCLPGGISLHRPAGAKLFQGGYYPEAATPLYVTRGVGCVGMDMRLFCPPEVTLLTVRSQA